MKSLMLILNKLVLCMSYFFILPLPYYKPSATSFRFHFCYKLFFSHPNWHMASLDKIQSHSYILAKNALFVSDSVLAPVINYTIPALPIISPNTIHRLSLSLLHQLLLLLYLVILTKAATMNMQRHPRNK